METIVVGSAHRYEWGHIEHWWKSLILTGFNDLVHVLSYENSQQMNSMMKGKGIIVQPCMLSAKQVVIGRFKDLAKMAEWLDKNTWIISVDTNDLVFQYDPREFLRYVDKDIVVASEGVTFEDNMWTRQNLANSFPEHWDLMRGFEFYNAGSFAAKAGIMKDLAIQVYEMCMDKPDARNHDQAALNILLQTEYKDQTLFTKPTDLWCYCAASSMFASQEDAAKYNGYYPTVKNGKCYVSHGKDLTCMFHHYTRNNEIKRQTQRWVNLAWAKSEYSKF